MASSVNRVLGAVDAISEWSGRIFSLAILGATLVVVYEVVMRYAFNSPSSWGFELPILLAGASYLLSGAYAERHDAHVRVDLLYARWSPRTQAIVEILTAPVFLFAIGALLWHGADWTLAAYDRGTTTGTVWAPPAWPVRLAIPLGSALLLLQGLARLVRNVQTIASGSHAR